MINDDKYLLKVYYQKDAGPLPKCFDCGAEMKRYSTPEFSGMICIDCFPEEKEPTKKP